MFPEKPVVYIAPRGYENELVSELSLLGVNVYEQRGRLFYAKCARRLRLRFGPRTSG